MLMTFYFSFLLTLFTWMAGVLLTIRLKNRKKSQAVPIPVKVSRLIDVF